MAKEGGDVSNKDLNRTQDDVFVNGENDNESSNLLTPECTSKRPPMIPRRSSLVKDTSRRSKDRKKTVSFSSMPNEKKVANAPDCLNYMQNGCELIKVRSNSRQYHRFFALNADCTEIRWHPSSKKASKARIPISEIKEVRVGKNTDVLRRKEIDGNYANECAFSIIYSEQFDSMDLIASTPDEANIWVTGLTCLISKNKGVSETLEERQQLRDQWLLGMFETADTNQSGQIDERQVVALVKKLNTGLTTTKIQQKLKELAIKKERDRGRLTSSEFISLFKEIATRPEIYFLLVRYASSSDHLTVEDLILFLEAEQGMTRMSRDRCVDIINQYEPSTEGRKLAQLGIDGFTAFLLAEECDIFDVTHRHVTQDMTQPLSHYFIASSHNTYLLEDQLKGPSSTEGYVRALLKGARYLEMDTWDGPNDEPVVWHGNTLTSKVPFKSVIEAINQHAFKTSQFPVILSIENHCSIAQQQFMVKCMVTTFGDKLYTQTIDPTIQHLPSPEQLSGKILIKGKKFGSGNKDTVNEEEEGYVTEEDEIEADRRTKSNRKEGHYKRIKLLRELSDLVTYCRSTRFTDLHTSAIKQKCYELCSLSESQALKLSAACPEDLVTNNKHFLTKVYPNGMRVDSSNFNPQDLWNSGCQLVALNYQTAGLMMDLNDGRFLANGGCGYVIKPCVMRDEISFFSANTRDVIPGVSPQLLYVKVISGQNLPKPKGAGARGNTIDPYVSVEVFGIPADCCEERTKTVQHDGNSPIFDDSFEFQINLPELALVRFAVLDDEYIGDEFIGQYTIPFECMQTGYRHIRLKSNNGEEIPNCTLFVHIAITNKSGGGKTLKRRLSSGKNKRKFGSGGTLKTVGIKPVDDSFKDPVSPLRQSITLRENVHAALSAFKEACGVAESSNIKQCLRTLSSRVHMSCDSAPGLHLDVKDDLPYLEASGNIPEALKKAFTAFDTLVTECKAVMNQWEDIHRKLISGQQLALNHQEELVTLAQQQNLKGKKLNKAMENYAWNIRMLKGQADLIQQANNECQEYLQQAKEAAYSLGLMSEESDSSGACSSPVMATPPGSELLPQIAEKSSPMSENSPELENNSMNTETEMREVKESRGDENVGNNTHLSDSNLQRTEENMEIYDNNVTNSTDLSQNSPRIIENNVRSTESNSQSLPHINAETENLPHMVANSNINEKDSTTES